MIGYQYVEFNETLTFQWGFSSEGLLTDIEKAVSAFNDLKPLQGGLKVVLSSVLIGTLDVGDNFIICNRGDFPFTVQTTNPNGSTTDLIVMADGKINSFWLTSRQTSNGQWRVIPWGEGSTSISSLDIQSTSNSLIVTDGQVVPPNGIVKLDLATILKTLNNLPSDGVVIYTKNGPNAGFNTRLIGNDSNLKVTNPSGVSGPPTVSLNSNVSVNSLTFPGLKIQNNQISSTTATVGDGNIVITGSTAINLNNSLTVKQAPASPRVSVDGNFQVNGDLNITGTFNKGKTSEAWVVFTGDGTVYFGNNILTPNGVQKVSTGNFKIIFSPELVDENYAVATSFVSGGTTAKIEVTIKNKTDISIKCLDSGGTEVDPDKQISLIIIASK